MLNGFYVNSIDRTFANNAAALFGDIPSIPSGSRRVLVLAQSDGTFGFANDSSDADENMIANALNGAGWRVISVQGLSNWAYQTDYYITVDVINTFSNAQILQQIRHDLSGYAVSNFSIVSDLTSNDPSGILGITPKDLTSFANSIEPAIGSVVGSAAIGGTMAIVLVFAALYLLKR